MSGATSPAGRLAALWPYLLVGFLYLATSPYHRGLNNPNEMVRLYMSAAWVEDGTFDIGPIIRRWGMVDDKAERDGVLYSSKAPLQSLIGVPAYEASGPVLEALGEKTSKRNRLFVVRILGSVVFGLAFAGLLVAYARRRAAELGAPEALGTGLGLVAALGTMVYPYALTFTGHLLAAFAAGGAYLALVRMARYIPGTRGWRLWAVVAGFAGGATPFAEYPAALVAGPALVAAFVMTRGARRRAELVGWLALGGALPFGLGLWSHAVLWGSPLATGYSFLENKNYVQVHGEGFFGVSTPKAEALGGALFSPGTGLFFFSPVLLVGLAMLFVQLFGRWLARTPAAAPAAGEAVSADIAEDLESGPGDVPHPIPRALAWAALAGFALSLYFISSHRGWRGGWTVGPRYIIAVAPLLWVWVVEAAARPKVRPFIAAFGAASILITGFAAALYPHLSDVYTNPVATFLVPSYLRGESTYGLAYWVGLHGQAANLVHVLPLLGAMLYVAFAGYAGDPAPAETEGPGRLANPDPRRIRRRRLLVVLGVFALELSLLAAIPERDDAAAQRENRRLWGFWEPTDARDKTDPRARTKGRIYQARRSWRSIVVEQVPAEGSPRRCVRKGPSQCQYGDNPWQHFGPDTLQMDGENVPVLFMHPIAGARVRATMPSRQDATHGVLRFGLADASVTSDNDAPVQVALRTGDQVLVEAEADNQFGYRALEFTITSTQPLVLDIRAQRDGARVFGWDIDLYRE